MVPSYGHPALNVPSTSAEHSYVVLATIAAPLLSYAAEAAFVGALTMYNSGLLHRRKFAMYALALAAATEMWWMHLGGGATASIRQNQPTFLVSAGVRIRFVVILNYLISRMRMRGLRETFSFSSFLPSWHSSHRLTKSPSSVSSPQDLELGPLYLMLN